MSGSSNLLEAQVKQVMSARGTGKGTRGIHVQCFVCSKMVRKLRLHIRKSHKDLCPVSCSACPAKFVGRNDLSNHQRNGCPRGLPSPPKASLRNKRPTISLRLKSKDIIGGLAQAHRAPPLDSPPKIWTPRSPLPWQTAFMQLCKPSCASYKQNGTFFENVDFSDLSAVNNFISNELQLDETNRRNLFGVVDRVYQYLQHNLPEDFSINKLVKGGSVGKGTAVKDKADIDCVVFLNNLTTMKEHKRDLSKTKNCLESCLKQSPYKGQITIDDQTQFAVQFKLRLNSSSREFHVDLLPTFNTGQSHEQLYEEMISCATEDRGYYAAHFVSLQVEFVKSQQPNVKDLIRLVKYWRKTCIDEKRSVTTRLPSSYPLELITIACWENAGKPLLFDIRAGFKAVLQQLVDNCHVQVIWYNYYNEAIAELASGIKGMKSKRQPFVMDPANPHNNVYSASDAEGWKIVADVAKTTLERQPLKDVIFNRNWHIYTCY